MRYSQRPQYIQQGLLGKGSFAEVYRVRLQNKLYALKRIYNYHLKDPKYSNTIKRQISIMQKLDHPNIIKLLDVYETQNSLELLLEYVPGGNLYDRIKEQSRITESTAKMYIRQIVSAVKYLHSFKQPILHRDIKPQNILISSSIQGESSSQNSNSSKGIIKLCDFGSANLILPDQTRHSYVGTQQYMAPQMKQCKQHDQSLDLWCIGVLMYQLLVGDVPEFHQSKNNNKDNDNDNDNDKDGNNSNNEREIVFPDYISKAAQNLIKKMLVKDQNKRISIKEIQEHVWFSEPKESVSINNFIIKGTKNLNINETIQRIKNKNKQFAQKIVKIDNKSSNQLLQLQKSTPMLMSSSSMMNKTAQQNAYQYIKQFKAKHILQQEMKQKRQKIQYMQKQVIKLRQFSSTTQSVISQQLQTLQSKITHLQQSQPQTHPQICLKNLQILSQNLTSLYKTAQNLPIFYKNRILCIKQPQIQQIVLPISQYLPKLKIKMLQHRRDALIQMKCLMKRKVEIQALVLKDQYYYGDDREFQGKYGDMDQAQVSTENIIIKGNSI